MIEKRRIVLNENKKNSERHLPAVIKWKGINMVRNHSFLATIREIVDYSDEMDVVRIGIIGDMMSGKSTLSLAIAHAIHIRSKFTFQVRVFYRDDLKQFKKTMGALKPANYILVFDDVSFLKDTSKIEQEVTEIRHMDGGQDVKIILIFNFHYPKALPPFLREFQFKYVTSIGTDNEKTIIENYGKNNLNLCQEFKKSRKQAITKKFWFEKISLKGAPIKYNFRDPFIPVLFWNETSLRKIVSPTRYFMDKICSICESGEGNKEYDEMTIAELCKHGEKLFGSVWLSSIKLLLHANGISVLGKTLTKSLRWIEKERKLRNIPLEAFAANYNLTETKTRLRAKPFDESNP